MLYFFMLCAKRPQQTLFSLQLAIKKNSAPKKNLNFNSALFQLT